MNSRAVDKFRGWLRDKLLEDLVTEWDESLGGSGFALSEDDIEDVVNYASDLARRL